MDTRKRLAWQIKGHRHFVAYPNGSERKDQFAVVQWVKNAEHLRSNPPWHWHVAWPGRFHEGAQVDAKQRAADVATEAWWKGVAAAEAREAAKRPVIAFMAKLAQTGEFNLADIDLETIDYRHLMLMMDESTRRWRGDTTLPMTEFEEPFRGFIAILSAEFHRRRRMEQ